MSRTAWVQQDINPVVRRNYGDRSPRSWLKKTLLLDRYQFDTTVLEAILVSHIAGNRLGFAISLG